MMLIISLADRLHKSIEEVMEMTCDELVLWAGYFELLEESYGRSKAKNRHHS
jgi:hypothetical protein